MLNFRVELGVIQKKQKIWKQLLKKQKKKKNKKDNISG
jgi:hypothetical protein